MTARAANSLGFLACAALLGYAYYAQYVMHLEPCPLCIFQRVGIFVVGMAFALAAAIDPVSWGRKLYAAAIAAGRHAARAADFGCTDGGPPPRWWRARRARSAPHTPGGPSRRDPAGRRARTRRPRRISRAAEKCTAGRVPGASRTGRNRRSAKSAAQARKPREFALRAVISGALWTARRRSAWRHPRARCGGYPCRGPCRSRTRRCSWRDRRSAPGRARST